MVQPQLTAMVLTPESCLSIAKTIVSSEDHYTAGIAAGREAIRILRDTHKSGALKMSDREAGWLDRLEDELDDLPDTEEAFVEEMMEEVDTEKFIPADYDLPS